MGGLNACLRCLSHADVQGNKSVDRKVSTNTKFDMYYTTEKCKHETML